MFVLGIPNFWIDRTIILVINYGIQCVSKN